MNADTSNGQQGAALRRSRAWWLLGGFLLQAAGAGGVAAFLWLKVRHEDLGGHITTVMIRLAWHAEVHTRQGLAVLVAGALVYAAGSVVMARPYVRNPLTLLVAVPAAAVAGMLLLGILAVVVALIVVLAGTNSDINIGSSGGTKAKRKDSPASAMTSAQGDDRQ